MLSLQQCSVLFVVENQKDGSFCLFSQVLECLFLLYVEGADDLLHVEERRRLAAKDSI